MTVTRVAQTVQPERAAAPPSAAVGESAHAFDREPAGAPIAQQEWRWIPDPAEAADPGPHRRSEPRSAWTDNLIRAMALAKLHGTW